jgi:hypothetical protein
MRSALALAVMTVLALSTTPARAQGGSILFIGNSFTFGWGSPVRYYRADTVTDLNGEGIGGMPALFKSFTVQSGLDYDVHLETHPGIGIDWHLDNKLDAIGRRPWNIVVMHGFSTLDPKKPGDPTVLISTAKKMAEFLAVRNAAVDVRVMATWARADQTYDSKGAWYGKPIEAMAKDVRGGYDKAAASTSLIKGVVPVGQAWTRAIESGVADANPYDGVDAGKVNLWSYDNYHASTYGYYLEALVVFGSITGRDPRSLGENECSGFELGLSPKQVAALEQVAYDELAAAGPITPAPLKLTKPTERGRCVHAR